MVWTVAFPSEINGNIVEKRVVFPKGKGTVSYRGKLPLKPQHIAYVVPARKGRFLTIKLISTNRDAYFTVHGSKSGDEVMLSAETRAVVWTGQIPDNGEYSIQVFDSSVNTRNQVPYTIEISVL